jgi:putative transposase
MSRHSSGYASDLSDQEWAVLSPLLPPPKSGGRPRKWPLRLILDGIFYVLRTGCAWRFLPKEFPPWSTVHHYFRLFRRDGLWERLHTALREQLRCRLRRNPQPSACVMDSQSVKTTGVGGVRGYDGAKKLSGRKRHVLVDTLGLLLRVVVHAADLQDRAAVPLVLKGIQNRFPRLEHVWADQGYTGTGRAWVEEQLGWSVEIVRHPPKPRGAWVCLDDPEELARLQQEWARIFCSQAGFWGVLPRRWVVERTFAWLGHSRRLSKDYERLCESSEALIYAAMARIMLRRLAHA